MTLSLCKSLVRSVSFFSGLICGFVFSILCIYLHVRDSTPLHLSGTYGLENFTSFLMAQGLDGLMVQDGLYTGLSRRSLSSDAFAHMYLLIFDGRGGARGGVDDEDDMM